MGGCEYLADVIFREENVSGSQVSMDELLTGEIVHAQRNLRAEIQQSLGKILRDILTWTGTQNLHQLSVTCMQVFIQVAIAMLIATAS